MVFEKRPRFAEVVSLWGDRTWLQYYTQDFQGLGNPSEDVLSAIAKETESVLGEWVGKEARASVAEARWTNTADHHGLLCHPYFFSTALARSHSEVRKGSEATVTLPFGGVSLSNDSFPRGFFFHDTGGAEVRIHFKSLKDRRMPVYALDPLTKQELIQDQMHALAASLSRSARERLHALFAALLSDERMWSLPTYSAQLTLMNSILWHELFLDGRGDFVYLEIDSVVRRLLLEKHLKTETVIHSLLFNAEWRTAFIELFSGVMGSHSPEWGTHLFWYIDRTELTRRGLSVQGSALVTKEGDVSISLDPESIAKGLEERTLMPSSALLLIIIQGVEGLACGGGPSQLEYLDSFMAAWHTLLQRFGKDSTAPSASILCGDTALFEMLSPDKSSCELATLLDILLYEGDAQGTIDHALSRIALCETVDAMVPMLYQMYTRERLPAFPPCTVPKIIPV